MDTNKQFLQWWEIASFTGQFEDEDEDEDEMVQCCWS